MTEPDWPSLAACLAALGAAPPGAGVANRGCVRIDVENALSPTFVVRALVVQVDGTRVYARVESPGYRGELDLVSKFTVSLGQMAPGPHELRVGAWLVANTNVDPSLRSYRWQICSKHDFTVAAGGGVSVTAELYEKRGEQSPPEEWPATRYLEHGTKTPPSGAPAGVFPPIPGCPQEPGR